MIAHHPERGPGNALDLSRRRIVRDAVERIPTDRLPPHSIEAEQGVLGAILLSPNDNLGECIEQFKAGAAVFYDLRHQAIYSVLVEMYDAKEAIDLITVQQRLKDARSTSPRPSPQSGEGDNLLGAIGGFGYLAELPDKAGSAGHLGSYAQIVWEKYILRRMLRTCGDVSARVYEHEGEVDVLLDEVETEILKISEERVEERSLKIKDLVAGAITQIEELHQSGGLITGVSTGFPDLDRMTTGLHAGEMIVIAARPSMGKTSLAMNIAEHVALEQKLAVGVFSLEMSAESLVQRMLCSRSRVNLRNVNQGFLSERDFPKLASSAGRLAAAPLHIDDTPGLSILQLRAKARRLHSQHGIKLFVIDYLQLCHSTARRAENRQQEIADISGGIKALAKELGVPVIVLSQLNREMEKDKSRKPRLSDLRESGAIEQDADLVGLLYKPSSDDEEYQGEQESIAVNLLIAKQRNGPTGDVNLTFMKNYTRFESAAKVSAEDVPE